MDNFEVEEQNFDFDKIDEIKQAIEQAQEEQVQEVQEQPSDVEIVAQFDKPESIPDLEHWEEFCQENTCVKKYITYISKDFVNIMDKMSTDERSAYINDAIQKKIDIENEELQIEKKKTTTMHTMIAIATIIIATPFMLLGVNKAIMHTFDNYKYSQDNFERLYKHRFEKEKVRVRTLQHNLLNKNTTNNKGQ